MQITSYIFFFLLISALQFQCYGQNICIEPDGYTPVLNGSRKEITVCPKSFVYLRAKDCISGTDVSASWKHLAYGFETATPNPYTVSDSGTVVATWYSGGMAYRDTIKVKWSESLDVFIYEDKARTVVANFFIKCEYEEGILYAPTHPDITSYSWFDAFNPSVTLGTADSIVLPARELTFSDNPDLAVVVSYKNCNFSDTIPFLDATAPETGLPDDTFFCQGSQVILNLPVGPNYDWYDASNTFIFNGSPFTTDQIGKLYIQSENIHQCQSKDSILIYESPKPVLTLSNDTSICPGSSASLTADAAVGTGPYSFYWNPGSSLSDSSETNVYSMSVTATPASATTYTVLTIDSRFCSDTGNVSVSLHPAVIASVPFTDTSACAGIPIFLDASGTAGTPYTSGPGFTYSWAPASEIISGANTANPEVSPADTVIYTVTVTDSIGCSDSETVQVKTPDMSVQITGGPEIFACSGDTVDLTSAIAGGEPGYTYLWESTAWLQPNTSSSRAFTLSDNTQVKLTATDTRGCSEADSVILRIGSRPAVSVSQDQYYLCFNDSVQIDPVSVSPGTGPADLTWTNPATLSDATSPAPIFYSQNMAIQTELVVSVVDSMGCDGNSDTLFVETVAAPPVNLVQDTTGCLGTPVSVSNNSFGEALAYEWYALNGTTILSADSSLQADTAGTYIMIVTEPLAACENRDTVNIAFVVPPSYLYIQTDTVAPNHLPHQMTAISNGQDLQFQWTTDGNGIFTNGNSNPVIYNPTSDDVRLVSFTVTALNQCGVLTADTLVRFYFDESNLPALIYIPNVFSPASTRYENRSLLVFGNKISSRNFLFRVYSRWGNLLYETTEFSTANTLGWNGTNQSTGEMMHVGVYTYTVIGEFEDGTVFEKTGNVTLIY